MDQWWNNVTAGFDSFSHGVEDTAHHAAGGFNTFTQEVGNTAHHAANGFDTFSQGVVETAYDASNEVASFSEQFLTNVNDWINQVAVNIQKAIEAGDSSELVRWLKKASKAVGFDDLLAQLAVVKLEDLPRDILNYVRENPGEVAFFVLGTVVLIAPVVVWGPAFAAMGWSAKGIQAGTFAARWQSVMAGHVVKKGVFATLTSASMGGYGMAAANGAVRTGTALALVANKHSRFGAEGHGSDDDHSDEHKEIEDDSETTPESAEHA